MAILTCKGCGGRTNSTTSDYVDGLKNRRIVYGEAERCFLRLTSDHQRYEKGCAFDQATPSQRSFAEGILKAQET